MRRLAALVFIALGFLSCRQENPPAVRRSIQAAAHKPQMGGRLVRRLENDIATLNPILYTTEYERYVLSYIHDPIVDLDRDLKPIPGTAASWDIGDGGRSYTFHIDPRATFSDRTPVRASDVLFTVRKIVSEQSPQFSSWFDALDEAQSKVLDDRTVRFMFREPRAAQLLSFNVAVLPEHAYAKGNFKNDFNNVAIGDGPYKLLSREPGKTILLQRRSDYWRETPPIDSILFRVLSADPVAWMAAKRGDLDELRVKPDVWAAEKDMPDVVAKLKFADAYLLQYNCIAWNLDDPALKDPSVRRALAMAYDKRSIIAGLYRGQARPITGPFTPDQWAYNSNVAEIPYDPNGAKSLLHGRTPTIEMIVPAGSATAAAQTQAYQSMLKNIGVQLDIRAVDGAVMFQRIMKGQYQSAFMAWSNDPDPDPFALFHSSQVPPNGLNIVRYRSPEADGLIDAARREFDPAKRRDLLHRVHAVIARDQPYLFTVQVATKWALNRRIQNAEMSKGFGLFFWYPGPRAWWLTP